MGKRLTIGKNDVKPGKCVLKCGKKSHSVAGGDHDGTGSKLGTKIFENSGISGVEEHDWYDKKKGNQLEGHHLIDSATMRGDNDWKIICEELGYDINNAKNGVMLPNVPQLACHLKVPLHKRNHSATTSDVAEDENITNPVKRNSPQPCLNYVNAVTRKTDAIKLDAINGKLCSPGALEKKLNTLSGKIFGKVKAFLWTITYDGHDYSPKLAISHGIGCGGLFINKGFMDAKRELHINREESIKLSTGRCRWFNVGHGYNVTKRAMVRGK